MKILFAIKSCWDYRERREACRQTWLRGLDWADHKFFVGIHERTVPVGYDFSGRSRVSNKFDEPEMVVLPVDDGFKNIAPKIKGIAEYAFKNEYNKVVICDDDAYVATGRIRFFVMDCGSDEVVGYLRDGDLHWGPTPYPQGACYILGRHAIATLAEDAHGILRDGIPDDVAVGHALWNRIVFVHLNIFHPGPEASLIRLDNDLVSTHKCSPLDMRRIHTDWLASVTSQSN